MHARSKAFYVWWDFEKIVKRRAAPGLASDLQLVPAACVNHLTLINVNLAGRDKVTWSTLTRPTACIA